MTPQTFCPGGCIMFVCRPGVAGCPRRLPNKKLTKSYTRYPVGGASGPVRRSLWPGPAVPGRSMAVHAPDPGLYCAQRLLHSSIALNGRRGSPPFQGFGVVEPQLGRWRPSLVHRSPAHNLSCRNSTYTLYVSAVPRSEKHRQWPSPVGFRALKKRRSTRLNRPTPARLAARRGRI